MRFNARLGWSDLGRAVFVLTFVAIAAAQFSPSRAAAQCAASAPACDTVDSTPKATIGVGLLGAEVGLLVPAIAGLRETWAYIVFPLVGAAGGAVGGYFIDQGSPNQPEISVALLAIGVGLAVPAVVGTLALTAYRPPEDAAEADDDMTYDEAGDSVEAVQDSGDSAPTSGSSSTSGSDPQAALQQRIRALYAGGPGLFRLQDGGLRLAMPMVHSLPTYTAEELQRLNLRQTSDINVPVFSATF